MKEAKSILPVWQPVGFSTHLIAQRVAELYQTKTSHTGTLDPMAEGVVIILLGEERHKKYEYAEWRKEYDFEITFGITTDTLDGLGRIIDIDLSTSTQIINLDFIGKYTQTYPAYSTKKIKGKHLHQLARDGVEITPPTKEGEIYKLRVVDTKSYSASQLSASIISKVNSVTGDFRQEEIIKQWKDFADNYKPQKLIAKRFCVEMSKGLYVRSLSQDICERNNTLGFVSNLTRTKNGNYNKGNSSTLEEIFGDKYLENYDFVSRFVS